VTRRLWRRGSDAVGLFLLEGLLEIDAGPITGTDQCIPGLRLTSDVVRIEDCHLCRLTRQWTSADRDNPLASSVTEILLAVHRLPSAHNNAKPLSVLRGGFDEQVADVE
jgi:hypothetical protein